METSPNMRGRIALLIILLMILINGIKINAYELHEQPMFKLEKKMKIQKQNVEKSKLSRQKYLEYQHQKAIEYQQAHKPRHKHKKVVYGQILSEEDAKNQIAQRESHNDYNAVSSGGRYIGKYQLDRDYLNGDYSPENQERTADEYVKSRYGSWENARRHQQQYGWY